MHDAACISDLVTEAGSRFLYSHSKVTLSLFKLQKRKVILLFWSVFFLYFLISVCACDFCHYGTFYAHMSALPVRQRCNDKPFGTPQEFILVDKAHICNVDDHLV